MGRITRSGNEFRDGGHRVRGFMANWYGLIQNDYSSAQLDTYFSKLQELGIIGVRTWAFNKSGTPSNTVGYFRYRSGSDLLFVENTYASLDRVLASAAKYGRKVVLVLSDNFPEFSSGGHKQTYVGWCNSIHGTAYDAFNKGDDFHLDSRIIDWKKEEIAKLAGRNNTVNGKAYVSDDTIFTLEMINEGRFTSGTDSNADTTSSYRYTSFLSWMDTVSTFTKQQFPNTLVGTGSISQFLDNYTNDSIHNGTYYGMDYQRFAQLANIDYCDFHMYPLEDPSDYRLRAYGQRVLGNGSPGRTRQGFLAQINEYISVAKSTVNKPSVIGEMGIDKRATVATAVPTSTREDYWLDFATDFFSRGGDILNMWHVTTSPFDDNNYNVKLDGVHTDGNANGNANDDDTRLMRVMQKLNQELLYGRPLSGTRPASGPRPARL